ncbi:MAG: hypothetical protein GTO14_09835 [Anaerolineales bacterium]|nr:hypothetical protein [Anaerolineales bacterium]
MSTAPCRKEVDELREAINAWVQASEATRRFTITGSWKIDKDHDTFPPGYFREMQEAFERERQARERYIRANIGLFDCMQRHKLID